MKKCSIAWAFVTAVAGCAAPHVSSVRTPPDFRQIAPLSTATVTSRTPTLRWVMPNEVDGARVELCRNRAMTSRCTTLDATGTSVAPSSALAPGVWYWRASPRTGGQIGSGTNAVWQFRVGARSAGQDASWGTEPDFDGDGIADVAAGSGLDGHVFVFMGTSAGPSAMPARSYAGTTVASAGDVDGDGFTDLVVGASSGADSQSTAAVFLGGPLGPSMDAAVTLHESDGPTSDFGWSVAPLGDIDGDGYADIAVGGNGAEHVWVFHGGPSGIDPSPTNTLSGRRIASAGDVNGDGFGDVIAEGGDGSWLGYAAFDVYFGSRMGIPDLGDDEVPTTTTMGVRAFSFGTGAGDVNGDGFADVLRTTIDTGSGTTIAIHLGGSAGLSHDSTVLQTPMGSGGELGWRGAAAGDLNADGFDDIAIGTGTIAPSDASLSVFLGSATGITAASTGTFVRDDTMCAEGGLAAAGDLDGDGVTDLAVGHSCAAPATTRSTIDILRGDASGSLAAPTSAVPSPEPGPSGFGSTIAGSL